MRTLPLAFGLMALWTLTTAGMCAHDQPPKVVIQQVRVPIPTPCDPKVSDEPDWTATDHALSTGEAADMLRYAYAGYKVARAYIAEQKAALEGCRKAPAG